MFHFFLAGNAQRLLGVPPIDLRFVIGVVCGKAVPGRLGESRIQIAILDGIALLVHNLEFVAGVVFFFAEADIPAFLIDALIIRVQELDPDLLGSPCLEKVPESGSQLVIGIEHKARIQEQFDFIIGRHRLRRRGGGSGLRGRCEGSERDKDRDDPDLPGVELLVIEAGCGCMHHAVGDEDDPWRSLQHPHPLVIAADEGEPRSGKLVLTEAGEALHHYARRIHALMEETYHVMGDFTEGGRGTVRIGASHVPGAYLLPDVLNAFDTRYPDVTVHLEIQTAPAIEERLRQHELDIGLSRRIRSRPTISISKSGSRTSWCSSCRPGIRWRRKERRRRSGSARSRLFFHDTQSATRRIMLEWANAHGIKLTSRLHMNSIEAIKRAVIHGQGVTLLSERAVSQEAANGTLIAIRLPERGLKRFIYRCYHKERWISPPVKAMWDMLQQYGTLGKPEGQS